jgi:sugar fermentation stimulation protein A
MLSDLVQGTVIDRPNRFLVYADVDGKRIMAHIADSGRLRELIFPGNVVMLKSAASLERKHPRKTSHDVVMGLSSETKKVWVSVDTRYPNILFGEALRRRLIHEFFPILFGKARV